MKRIVFVLVILGLVLLSCVPVNHPPTAPTNPSPSNGATDVSLMPTLSWEASDPDGDTLTFDLYFGIDSNNLELEKTDLIGESYATGTLNSGTKYYWKVVAKEGKGGETEGPIWSFITQQPNIEWDVSLNRADDFALYIQQTSDGGYIVAGYTWILDEDLDCWIVKLNGDGSKSWDVVLGGSNDDVANSIQQTSDGGYIIAEKTSSNDGDVSGNPEGEDFDYWIVKLNSDGSKAWDVVLGGSYNDEAYSIQQTSDGGYIVAGGKISNAGDIDYWIIKFSK